MLWVLMKWAAATLFLAEGNQGEFPTGVDVLTQIKGRERISETSSRQEPSETRERHALCTEGQISIAWGVI